MVLSDGVHLLNFGFSRSIRRGNYSDDVVDDVRQLEKLLGWSTNGLLHEIPIDVVPYKTLSGIIC